MSVIRSLKHNLANLHRLRGRDAGPIFWPYAIVVFVLTHIALGVVMAPWMIENMLRTQRFAAEHPQQGEVRVGPGHYSSRIEQPAPGLTDMSEEKVWVVIVWAVATLLLAAAVARRLRDRGWSAWWGLMPLPFLFYFLLSAPTSFGDPVGPLAFAIQFGASSLFFVALIGLIALLAGPSRPAESREEIGNRPTA